MAWQLDKEIGSNKFTAATFSEQLYRGGSDGINFVKKTFDDPKRYGNPILEVVCHWLTFKYPKPDNPVGDIRDVLSQCELLGLLNTIEERKPFSG